MDNILPLISTAQLIQVHRILQDRNRERHGCKSTNYDELMLVKKEMQRRIDAFVNPYDRLPYNTQQYAKI